MIYKKNCAKLFNLYFSCQQFNQFNGHLNFNSIIKTLTALKKLMVIFEVFYKILFIFKE